MSEREIWIDVDELLVEFNTKEGYTVSTWRKRVDDNHFVALLEEIQTIVVNMKTKGFIIDARNGVILGKSIKEYTTKRLMEISKDLNIMKQAFVFPNNSSFDFKGEPSASNGTSNIEHANARFFNNMDDAVQWIKE